MQTPKRPPLFLFSLRTLLILVLLCCACAALWKNRQPWVLERVFDGHKDKVCSAVFSPDGRRILTASDALRLWDVETGQLVAEYSPGMLYGILPAAFTPDGQRAFLTHYNEVVEWDFTTGEHKTVFEHNKLNAAAYSPDGAKLLTVGDAARVWEMKTGVKLLESTDYALELNTGRFSKDGTRFITASRDGTARVYDAQTGAECTRLKCKYNVHCAFLSPDAKFIVTAGDDPCIWRSTGEKLFVLKGHVFGSWYADFSPDGARVVSTSVDGTAIVWDAATGAKLFVLSGHREGFTVSHAAYSPDCWRIATSSWDGTCRVWRKLRPEEWWGVIWRPECWVCIALMIALAWSFWRDRRTLKIVPVE